MGDASPPSPHSPPSSRRRPHSRRPLTPPYVRFRIRRFRLCGYTSQRSVQVLGFDDCGRLTPLRRLIRFLFVRPAFCLGLPSDSQSPATTLPLASTSPCRVCRGLAPPSRLAHHHNELNSASHGATRHAWRTTKKPRFTPREPGLSAQVTVTPWPSPGCVQIQRCR